MSDNTSTSVAVAFGTPIAAWVVATLLAQVSSSSFAHIAKRDPFGGLVPNWRFFAPNPASHDFRVAYRCLYADGTHGSWQAASNASDQRRLVHSVWNPQRRESKALSDISSSIVKLLSSQRHLVEASIEYQLLTTWVKRVGVRGSEKPIEGVQFALARDPGFDDDADASFLFISKLERIQPTT